MAGLGSGTGASCGAAWPASLAPLSGSLPATTDGAMAASASAGVSAREAVRRKGIGSAALLAAWCGLLANSAVIDTLHWRHLWLVAALIWAATVWSARRA